MERVRIAAIGTGAIFRNAHLPAYVEIPEAHLVALCDVNEKALKDAVKRMDGIYERRARKAEEEGDPDRARQLRDDVRSVRLYTDFHTLLKEEHPDLVDICTPPDMHAPLTIAALKAGCHVMCEKPMARTWLECLKVCEVVEETGLFYQHNENWLYDPFYYTARKLIDSGTVGEVVMMFLNTSHAGPENRQGFWEPKRSGGGALLDNGIHAVTVSWFLAGFEKRPVAVKAAAPIGITRRMRHRIINNRYQDFPVEDDGHILIRYEDPKTKAWTTAHVEGSWSLSDSPPTAILGTMGSLRPVREEGKIFVEITDAFGNKRRVEATGPTWTFWPTSFYGEIKNMVQCVLHGSKPLCDHRIGAESQAIVGAAYLSQRRGKVTVTVDEFKAWARSFQSASSDEVNEILIAELLKGL